MNMNSIVRVLLAEDDALVAVVIEKELQLSGSTVVGIAADGRQAVDLTMELKPDVVLMDITMPNLDGIAAATVIQAKCPTPVVILSAHNESSLVAQATEAGVGAFVLKPSQADELRRAMTVAIARHADLMQLRQMNGALQKTLAEVKVLTGLLPICSGCKKIRDDRGYWSDVEAYLAKRTDVQFSHSLCPVCMGKYFPDVAGA